MVRESNLTQAVRCNLLSCGQHYIVDYVRRSVKDCNTSLPQTCLKELVQNFNLEKKNVFGKLMKSYKRYLNIELLSV